MKKLCLFASLIFSAAAITALLTSCRSGSDPADMSASQSSGYTYISLTQQQTDIPASDITQESTLPPLPEEETHSEAGKTEETTAHSSNSQPTTNAPATERSTQRGTAPTEKPTSGKTPAQETEVDLSIDVPSANGTIEVDTSRGNKFTVIVSDERKIDAAYLLAVYSVPNSGQNYVFEFSSKTGRSEDDLRRVYLIDANGKITGVAAKKASEKENISAVENWFCMNVLIKNLLFPAVEKEFS